MKALTTKAIENLKPNPAKRLELPDPALTGLYLVVQPGGAKSWALRYRHAGKPKKLTLGRWPVMGLAEARQAATDAAQRVERGEDPAGEKAATKAARRDPAFVDHSLFRHAVETFLRRHASRNRRADDVAAMFRREVMEPWGDRKLQDITKRDCVHLLDAIVDRGSPITANRLRAHLNTFFTWARSRDEIAANPLEGVKPPAPEKPRDRVLTADELRLLWSACDGLGYSFGPIYRLLLLTGQRLREVAEMTWPEVKGDLWSLPAARSKNGDEHFIPLSPEVLAIMETLLHSGAGYVFTTNGKMPVSGFTRAKQRLDRAMFEALNKGRSDDAEPMQIPAFTIHDLRRTAASGMAALRFPPHIVEAVLNHKSGTRRGVAGVYNRHDYQEEKRAALNAWARYVMQLVEGKAENVVPISEARR